MMAMYKTKDITINIVGIKEPLKSMLPMIGAVCKASEGHNYVMTITSGKDGIHKRKSKHYDGEAIDIRIRDMKFPLKNTSLIKNLLGKDYDVMLEKDHIHIEYDKK